MKSALTKKSNEDKEPHYNKEIEFMLMIKKIVIIMNHKLL